MECVNVPVSLPYCILDILRNSLFRIAELFFRNLQAVKFHAVNPAGKVLYGFITVLSHLLQDLTHTAEYPFIVLYGPLAQPRPLVAGRINIDLHYSMILSRSITNIPSAPIALRRRTFSQRVSASTTECREHQPSDARGITVGLRIAGRIFTAWSSAAVGMFIRRYFLPLLIRWESILKSISSSVSLSCADFAFPVEAEANLVQLTPVSVDVLNGRLLRMLTCLDGILLSRQSIGIITHRVQHVETLLALISGIDITGDIAKRMTHMQTCSRWIREHVQYVEFLLLLVLHYAIGTIFHPSLLPFLFDFSEIVIHCCIFILIVSVHINLGCKDTNK